MAMKRTRIEPVRRRARGAALWLAAGAALAVVPAAAETATKTLPRAQGEIELSFAPLVRTAAPAVVNVFTRRSVQQGRPLSPFFNDPFFRRFFGEDSPFVGPRERIESSLGSGVIVAPSGLIVTNHHVIKDSDEITVALADRREFAATVALTDERTDLAVLRVDTRGRPLPFLELRDSDELEVGDLVLAIGNPFGVGQTVTSGIVSALARTQIGVADFRSFIQTDAAINPGNSGGALVSLDGKLAGINTAIFSRTGGSIGIGFAIPANMVAVVIDAAVRGGKVARPWLGVSGQSVDAEMSEALGLDRPTGVLINNLYPGGPAAAAGIEVGDIVRTVDGREVFDAPGLDYRIATRPLGAPTEIEILRDGEARKVIVPMAVPPEEPPRRITRLAGRHPLAGVTVANLSPAFAEELGLDMLLRGVVILEVARASAAQRIGFRPGDIVLSINDDDIDAVAALDEVLSAGAREWRVNVRRGENVLRVVVRG